MEPVLKILKPALVSKALTYASDMIGGEQVQNNASQDFIKGGEYIITEVLPTIAKLYKQWQAPPTFSDTQDELFELFLESVFKKSPACQKLS